jgi:hypothetical protein
MAKIDRKKLALIHIVKKELGLSDAEYRNILKNTAGVDSAKYLDAGGFRKLMNYLVRSGRYRLNDKGLTLKQKMFIKSLAGDLGWDDGHLNNFIRKYYHTDELKGLSRKEAVKLIESLKNIRKRTVK